MTDDTNTATETAGEYETLSTPGLYLIDAVCPRCAVVETVLCRIGVVLTTPDDGPGALRVKLKGKAVDHDCGQSRLEVVIGGEPS
jgi:hypothetical protein